MEDKLPVPADWEAAAVLILRHIWRAIGRCWHAGRVKLTVGRTNGSNDRANDIGGGRIYMYIDFDKW